MLEAVAIPLPLLADGVKADCGAKVQDVGSVKCVYVSVPVGTIESGTVVLVLVVGEVSTGTTDVVLGTLELGGVGTTDDVLVADGAVPELL